MCCDEPFSTHLLVTFPGLRCQFQRHLQRRLMKCHKAILLPSLLLCNTRSYMDSNRCFLYSRIPRRNAILAESFSNGPNNEHACTCIPIAEVEDSETGAMKLMPRLPSSYATSSWAAPLWLPVLLLAITTLEDAYFATINCPMVRSRITRGRAMWTIEALGFVCMP